MPAPDDLYPPAQYGAGWLLLAVGVLVMLILAVWAVRTLTAPRTHLTLPGQVPGAPPPASEALFLLRQEYLERIDRLDADYREGLLTPRQANLELSRLVRVFVNEYSGLEAPVLALDDLIAQGVHPALIDAIQKHYYPSIFRPDPALDAAEGVLAARMVVNSWH